jgi:purine-nucleoside phosphorylase
VREESEQAASVVRARAGGVSIDVGLVLDAGLAGIGEHFKAPISVPYAALPGFIRPASEEDGAELVIGTIGTARVGMLKGRVHHYETGDFACMRVPLETLALLGAKAVVFANAAGSVRPEIRPGALVAVRDHINLTGYNPLLGDRGAQRFIDLTQAYDPVLRERFQVAAGELGRKTVEAVFMWFPGPSFETPAEIQAARVLGADIVGMSTVPDVIIARQLGLRVLVASMITNFASGMADRPLGHEETLRVTSTTIVPLTRVLLRFFEIWVLDSRAVR